MRFFIWVIGIMIGLAITLAAIQYVASERVEVVELTTQDADGQTVITRLWIVDYNNEAYLRGNPAAAWYQRAMANELVSVKRAGIIKKYRPIVNQGRLAEINRLMREKYTWGDEIFARVLGSRTASNAIQLVLVD